MGGPQAVPPRVTGSCWRVPPYPYLIPAVASCGWAPWMAESALSLQVLTWSGAGGGPSPPTWLVTPAEPRRLLARLFNFSRPEARRRVPPIESAAIAQQCPAAL